MAQATQILVVAAARVAVAAGRKVAGVLLNGFPLLEAVLWETRVPRSSAIYRQVAERVSLTRCSVPSFQRMVAVLRSWYGREGQTGSVAAF